MGYVEGLMDSARLLASKVVCLPNGVTIGDATKVILKYADTHPEKLHLSKFSEGLLALSEAFPCPRMAETNKSSPAYTGRHGNLILELADQITAGGSGKRVAQALALFS
jgi:hypothetical protein